MYAIYPNPNKNRSTELAVFFNGSFKYPIYKGEELRALETVEMSNKLIADAKKRAKAAKRA